MPIVFMNLEGSLPLLVGLCLCWWVFAFVGGLPKVDILYVHALRSLCLLLGLCLDQFFRDHNPICSIYLHLPQAKGKSSNPSVLELFWWLVSCSPSELLPLTGFPSSVGEWPYEKTYENLKSETRWFQFVTFSSPSWRSLNHSKGSLNHPKKVTKNCQENVFLVHFLGGMKVDLVSFFGIIRRLL